MPNMENNMAGNSRTGSDLSWDAMEGLIEAPPPPPEWSISGLLRYVRLIAPGLLTAVVVGLAAAWIADHYGGPVMLFALLLGMGFHFLSEDNRCQPGIDLTARGVLRLGVGLLGLRVTFDQIAGLGLNNFTIIVCAVIATILFSVIMARVLGLEREQGVLSGGAVSICGASAALAIASVLPQSQRLEQNTIVTVIGVTTLSTIAMVLYPAFVTQLGMDHVTAGIFLGGTIHDVAQVVGAGYIVSELTGDTSTIVKLLRVAMLVPVVLCLSLIFVRDATGLSASQTARAIEKKRRKLPNIPWFLWLFLGLVTLNSFQIMPPEIMAAGSTVSRWCLLAAIAALGVKTSFAKLAAVGWRPVLILVLNTLFLAGMVGLGLYFDGQAAAAG